MVMSAIVLPAANGLCCVEGVLLPVLDTGLLVKERRSCAIAVRCAAN